jgi:DNA invertase Pin-like site-specific DNA recombinase
MKKAIAYTRQMAGKGNIEAAAQKEAIKKYAADNGIEIAWWFEDGNEADEAIARPGVKSMLEYTGEYEMVLVEKVWAIGQRKGEVEPVFEKLEKLGKTVTAATEMWDFVSQYTRRRFNKELFQPVPYAPTEKFVLARAAAKAIARVKQHA